MLPPVSKSRYELDLHDTNKNNRMTKTNITQIQPFRLFGKIINYVIGVGCHTLDCPLISFTIWALLGSYMNDQLHKTHELA